MRISNFLILIILIYSRFEIFCNTCRLLNKIHKIQVKTNGNILFYIRKYVFIQLDNAKILLMT